MPSRKQKRKREKLKRHEYEYVLETDEGEEIPLEKPRAADTANGRTPAKAPREPLDRRGRPLEKPSFRRVLRRSAIFTPLIAIFIYATTRDITIAALVFNVLVLLAFFMPFSYMVDLFVYRMLVRRYERERAGGRAR